MKWKNQSNKFSVFAVSSEHGSAALKLSICCSHQKACGLKKSTLHFALVRTFCGRLEQMC
jgi:hypothetical protein